ncbi:MAG: hypothetical protein WCY06_09670 [Flavobacteriaceae bacterium]
MKASIKIIVTLVLFIGISAVIAACSNDGDSDSGGGGDTSFSYTDIGPNLSSEWNFSEARRTDTGLWAWYYNTNTVADKLARYDFSSKQWQFWDFPMGIEDFDVWLEGEDNGNGAVVIENTELGTQVYSLSSPAPWDTENIDQPKIAIAIGWGAGSAVFTNWIGGTHYTNRAVYQQTSSCCPQEWNKIEGLISSLIYNMWASSRQDGYVLVTTANKSFIVYGDGGAEITFGGNSYAIEHLAWDTQTRIPYVLIDGILYKIEVNPNAHTAKAIEVADLTHLNYGVFSGSVPLDIRNGVAYVPYDGAAVNLSNGSITTSWTGTYNQIDINTMLVVNAIANSSQALFLDPNDSESIYVHIIGSDSTTYEPYQTWIRVNNAL